MCSNADCDTSKNKAARMFTKIVVRVAELSINHLSLNTKSKYNTVNNYIYNHSVGNQNS